MPTANNIRFALLGNWKEMVQTTEGRPEMQ
jgi:hypothetical protein